MLEIGMWEIRWRWKHWKTWETFDVSTGGGGVCGVYLGCLVIAKHYLGGDT